MAIDNKCEMNAKRYVRECHQSAGSKVVVRVLFVAVELPVGLWG